ncbi:MAG: hypothetical protein AAFZ92_01640 [Pseudomonadota bacterium]
MQSLVFSQAAVYQLQQLAKVVRDKTGVRHRLSDPKSVISLLRYSSTSPDADVFMFFGRFTNELDIEQRSYLQGKGLLLPDVLFEKIDSVIQRAAV